MKRILVGLALTTTLGLAVPATASADIGAELDAGDAVERAVVKRGYAKYDPIGLCDQTGRRTFWCDVSGMRGSCFLSGHARVRGSGWSWRVRIVNLSRRCI